MFSSSLLKLFPLARYTIQEKSMEPFLKEGDDVLVSKIFFKLKVGDIIILKHSIPPYRFCKRITKQIVKEYFVEGDNKKISIDSRKFGSIQRKNIIGKVILKI